MLDCRRRCSPTKIRHSAVFSQSESPGSRDAIHKTVFVPWYQANYVAALEHRIQRHEGFLGEDTILCWLLKGYGPSESRENG